MIPSGGGTIALRELEPSVVALHPGEAEFLTLRHARHLTVRPAHGGDGPRIITPGHVCGIIPLPSGRSLHIEPKARIASVWRMLAYAWDLPQVDHAAAGSADVGELLDGVIALYVRELARLIGYGLARGYAERRASLPMVRGRLDVWAQVRQDPAGRHRFACVYDELGVDTRENRVLLAALGAARAVSRAACRPDARASCGSRLGLGPLIRRCAGALSEVRPVAMGRAEIGLVRAPPGAEHYRTALALARLLLEGHGAGHRPGSSAAPALVVEMPALFERFVCGVLERGLTPGLGDTHGLRVRRAGHAIALDEDRRALLSPDAIIECRGVPVCVVDAKYKVGSAQQTPRRSPQGFCVADRPAAGAAPHRPDPDDLYQMLAYCVGYRTPHAALVYPEPCSAAPLRIERGSVRAQVHPLGLDLGGAPEAVRAQCERLCTHVAALATAGPGQADARRPPLPGLRRASCRGFPEEGESC